MLLEEFPFNPFCIFLMIRIIDCVEFLVYQYFITFKYCWKLILEVFLILIHTYIDLLKYVVKNLSVYPTNIICCVTCFCCLSITLYFINRYLEIIFDKLYNDNSKHEFNRPFKITYGSNKL
jgi:hypothetical protein